ncbi:hypothetical protein B0H63DRAFT_486870 [Podospora didyma]|uniref:Ankyrin repeat protein n=1 Tax=Podospora didyma TaxID=330526 RepID=A0AAE0N4W6_9PEZI|nr:hypothetical protein B0H63DRAFT_486870 [Podospora didyma]
MTPARLNGFDRWRPDSLNCAAILESNQTSRVLRRRQQNGHEELSFAPPGYVEGFLILGLRPEALRYLDLVFGSDRRTLRTMRPHDDEDRDEDDSEEEQRLQLLRRRQVEVQVQSITGEMTTVSTDTYVWNGSSADFSGGNSWEEERFLGSSPMQTLLDESQPTWAKEEQSLATIMKTSFVQAGDYLCGPIMAGNLEELTALLAGNKSSFNNPNAGCRVYGHPLQAAIAVGNKDMVQLLLDHDAKVNATGGQYGTPLIAATRTSRKAITKLLLHHGADVFAADRVHVNALYQAVANSDYAVTEMLLEHGAWLGRHWFETLDAAEEAGDEEIRTLLARYDVRKIHRQHMEDGGDECNDANGGGDWNGVRYSKVLTAVVRKVAAVHKVSGNWKGRRGVAVTVAALDAGAPLRLIGMLRNAVTPVKAIFDILEKGDKEQERRRQERSDGGSAEGRQSLKQGHVSYGKGDYQVMADRKQPSVQTRRKVTDNRERAEVHPITKGVRYRPAYNGSQGVGYTVESQIPPVRQHRVRFAV